MKLSNYASACAVVVLAMSLTCNVSVIGWAQTAAAPVSTNAATKAAAASSTDELLMQLPASDIVAVIDVKRVMGELLPRLKNISVAGIGKMASEIETFAKLSGIDPAQVQTAVLGVKLTETLSRGSGLLLLQGVSIDAQKLTAAAQAAGGELSARDYQGKQLFTLSLKAKPDAPASELFFAALDQQRLAIGDLEAVQSVLAAKAPTAAHVPLAKALKEIKESSLVRFAGNLPEGLRVMLASQGELFSQVAAVKAIFGSMDLNADNTATVAARARTASNNDAALLKESLGGLIALGKLFVGGDDPKSRLYSSLLDKVQISTQAQDVALTLILPKELME